MRAPHWLSKCMCDGKKRPLPILVNALIALRNDDGTRDAIAFDEMLRAPMLLHQIGHPIGGDLLEPRALTDKDVTDLQEWMQLAGLTNISHDNVRLAVKATRAITPIIPCSIISRACDGTTRRGSIPG